MYSYLVDYSSEHNKAKDINKNDVTTISHNQYRDDLLNNKSLRHSMNRITSKDDGLGIFEINFLVLL